MSIATFAEKHEGPIAVMLSLLVGIVWFAACNFDKSLTVYHDEVTYIESARDIYNGISPLLQHLRPSYFSKIFYGYLIAPGFAFNDPTLWQTLLNAVFSALTVLFTWLCSRFLIESCKLRIVCAFLTALLPIYSYTVYATPDCLFFCEISLGFLIFTALCRSILDGIRLRTIILFSVLLGMVNFVSYFTKEVSTAFIISETVALVLVPLVWKKRRKEFLLALAAGLLTSFLFYLYLKFILLPEDTGNSYQSQIIPLSEYWEHADWGILIYKFFYTGTAACFSVYLIPLLAPVFEFRRMKPLGQILSITVLCSFVILTLAVIYTISWAEDYSREYPHWQFRYHGAYLPVLLILTMLAYEKRLAAAAGSWRRLAALICFSVAMVLFYPRPEMQLISVYDNATINLFNYSLYFYNTGMEVSVAQKISLVLMLISVSVMFVPFIVTEPRQKVRRAGVAAAAIASVLFIVTGSIYAAINRIENGISPELKSDVLELASFLDRLKPQTIALLVEKERTQGNAAFYTYVRRPVMSIPAKVFLRDSKKTGSFDFTVPHHIGVIEYDYNSRYISPDVIVPSPDVIIETGEAFVEFPGKDVIFLSRNHHYAVIFNHREPNLQVKQDKVNVK